MRPALARFAKRLERTLGAKRICGTADGSSELKNRRVECRVRAARTGESVQVETELPPAALITVPPRELATRAAAV